MAALLSCRTAGNTLDKELDRVVAELGLDGRDRALAMELAYGVVRRLETIDWRLLPALDRPLQRLPVVVQLLLRLGAYQLLFMHRIPASAAVDETVCLAKSYKVQLGRDWSGFVNAVLRSLIRLPEPAPPDPASRPAQALSVRHAIPLWLCQRWVDRLGYEEAGRACLASSRIPSMTLRVNQRRMTREKFLERLRQQGIEARPTAISPVGVTLERGLSVASMPGFHEGDFYIEDEAAQLIPPLLDPQPGDFVLDTCAAPGGKATHLAELMDNRGCVLAIDRRRTRLELLHENCRRLGLTIVTAIVADARRPQDALCAFGKRGSGASRSSSDAVGSVDRVLVDAPCSGLGVLRRHPEARWQKHEAMFRRHHTLQSEILEATAAVLRPGGVLVYSTCSTEPEETEEVIARFCHDHTAWVRESVAPWLPSAARIFVTNHGALSTMGNVYGMDGFYAARLRKASNESVDSRRPVHPIR